MGLFDDFDVDMDEVEVAGGFDFKDGFYDFEISEALTQNGSKNRPDHTFFIIKYDLDENGTYWEWFAVAVGGDTSHADAKRGLGNLKGRLLDLGFQAAELNGVEPEDLEGLVGTLQLVTTQGKGKNAGNKYQNVRNVKVGETEEAAAEPEPEFDAKEAKARVAARQAARAEKAAPPARPTRGSRPAAPAADDADEENPFGG